MEQRGSKISIFSVDLCDREQVDQLINNIAKTLPPLRGIFQGGVVLDDVLAVHNSLTKYQRVADVKVYTYSLPLSEINYLLTHLADSGNVESPHCHSTPSSRILCHAIFVCLRNGKCCTKLVRRGQSLYG